MKSIRIEWIALVCLLSLLPALTYAATPSDKKNVKRSTANVVESTTFRYFVGKTPDWVQVRPIPEKSAETGEWPYRILLQDEQVQFSDQGKTFYHHIVQQPLQKSALDKVSQIEIGFSPEYQTLTLHSFAVWREGVRIDKLDRNKVRLIQREKELEKLMYNGMVSASVVLDDIRVGDILEYSYSTQGENPVFSGRIGGAFQLNGWYVPVGQFSYRLITPANRPIAIKGHHGDEFPPQSTEKNGLREVIWSRQQIPAFNDEEQYPRWHIPVSWVEYSEYPSWQQVSHWAEPMYRIPDDLSPELSRQIEQWQNSSTTPQEAALRALNFVQQEIRYFGVEIGTSSHLPSHPNQVFKQRYGDCKDKSRLLATILNKMGLKAWPALVSSRFGKAIADELPSPRAFDHVITKATIDGKVWWLDATNNFQAGDLEHRGYDDFGQALVIGDGSEDLTPISIPQNSDHQIEETYFIQAAGEPVTLNITERFHGNYANSIRALISTYGTEKLFEHFLNQHLRLLPGIRRDGQPSLVDSPENNEYTLTERYVIDHFFQRNGNRWRAELYDMPLRELLDYPKTIKRIGPLGLIPSNRTRYTATVNYAHRNTGSTDESLLIANDRIQFHTRVHNDGPRLTLHQELDFLSDHVPNSEVSQYVERLNQIRQRLGYAFALPDRATSVWSDNPAHQALLHAASIGDVAAIERALSQGVSPNIHGNAELTPLFLAAMEGKVEAVKLLLAKGARVNERTSDDWTPLLITAVYGSEATADELLQAGAELKAVRNGETALMLAAEKGHTDIVRLLLARGADVDQRNPHHFNHTALMYAALNGHATTIQALLAGGANVTLKDKKEFSPLLLAAESGDWPSISALLHAGSDIHETTPAHHLGLMAILVRSNRYDDIAAAIQAGAAVNEQTNNGFSPLMYAFKEGNSRVAALLLQHGARYRDINEAGWTPLMAAIEQQDLTQAKQLITSGANVNATDHYGVSALTLASAFGQVELANLLISKGAKVNVADLGWRETPLMYAVENGSKQMVELLVSHGANPNDQDMDGDSVLGRTWPMEKAELYDVLIAAGAKREFNHRSGGK